MTLRGFLLSLALPATGLAAAERVAFESFTYTGRDTVFAAPLPAGHFRNPILAGYYPDPSICRVGDDYYLINSSFAHFPGIPVFHSRDLVNWKQIGHVIDRPTQLNYDNLRITRGIFAPAISHHNGTFYVVCTMVDAGGNFLMTAKNPAGPWSDPVWLDFDGIDPSLFFDDDGRAWMVNNGNPPDNKPLYQGHRAIWIQEFDPKTNKLTGPRSIIVNGGVDLAKKPVWIEGPHLYKRNGWYYLCCAEGGTSVHHSQVILRSKAPTGPFVPWDKNPILTQRDLDSNAPHAVTCTGHADLEIGPDGQWWSIFLACRPYAPDRWATGRETFLLPVKWTDDGWPVILPPGERVPYIVKAPLSILQEDTEGTETSSQTKSSVTSVISCENGSVPLTGNFKWRDEFDQPALSPLWLMLRAPKETWWKLVNGQLHLTPRADSLSDLGQPSFLGRRIQHSNFDVSVSVAVPANGSTEAGLAVFQNEKQHFQFLVSRSGDQLKLTVLLTHQGKTAPLIQRTVGRADRIELSLKAEGTRYAFAYALPNEAPQTLLADVDSYPASVQAAGGGLHFTGAIVGPVARIVP
jgi:xylan 1,4-beta-xylosidase